jgi:hypothetical protein
MPEGYIQLIGGGARDVIAGLVRRQRERVELAITNTDSVIPNTAPWQPGQPFIDLAPRATPRQEAFDFGDEALPGYAWPPQRRTGWENAG